MTLRTPETPSPPASGTVLLSSTLGDTSWCALCTSFLGKLRLAQSFFSVKESGKLSSEGKEKGYGVAPGLAADTWGHCCSAWLFVGSPASPPFLQIPSVPHQALTVINRKSAAGRPVSFKAKQLELWLQPAIPRLRQSSHLRVPSLVYLVCT